MRLSWPSPADNTVAPGDQPIRPSDSARGSIATGLVVLIIFFGGFGTWAATAPLNGAVIGPAVVKVDGNRKSLADFHGGTVREIRVAEGDLVTAGDVLVVLDDPAIRGEHRALLRKHTLLKALEARLLAERDGRPTIAFPPELTRQAGQPDVAAAMTAQNSELLARRTAQAGKRDLLSRRIAQMETEIRGAEGERRSYRAQLDSIRSELGGLAGLIDRKLVSQQRVLQLERDAISLEGRIDQSETKVAGIKQAVGELGAEITQIDKERAEEIAGSLRDTRLHLAEVESRLEASEGAVARLTIRAPYSGRVVGLSLFSIGDVIRPGEPILDIVPAVHAFVVEAKMSVNDIADVAVGMAADVHLTSYNQRIVRPAPGRVRAVSADRLTDERSGTAYYAVEVDLDQGRAANRPAVNLYPGMPATVMIATRERTALDYIVDPLIESFDHAFRQR